MNRFFDFCINVVLNMMLGPIWGIGAAIALVLHFVIGLPLYWFWLTLGLWLLAGLVRYLLVRFARWGAQSPASVHENKNPYSGKTGPANR